MVGTLATFRIVGPALTEQAHCRSGIMFLVAVVAKTFSQPSAATTVASFLNEGVDARVAKILGETLSI